MLSISLFLCVSAVVYFIQSSSKITFISGKFLKWDKPHYIQLPSLHRKNMNIFTTTQSLT